jgi:hypothetical protein
VLVAALAEHLEDLADPLGLAQVVTGDHDEIADRCAAWFVALRSLRPPFTRVSASLNDRQRPGHQGNH